MSEDRPRPRRWLAASLLGAVLFLGLALAAFRGDLIRYSLDPKTAEWHFYVAPTKNGGAYGIAIDGDGAPWFAEDAAEKMGYLNLKTGKIEELSIKPKFPGERILPRRMKHLGDARVGHQCEEGIEIEVVSQGVDRHCLVVRSNLDDADLRPEGRFAQELGIDGDEWMSSEATASSGDVASGRDQCHEHLP